MSPPTKHEKSTLSSGLGLRLGNQFGQRAKVMANDLKPIALTHRQNWHPCPDLSPETFFLIIYLLEFIFKL
jgi:hypothetical protein